MGLGSTQFPSDSLFGTSLFGDEQLYSSYSPYSWDKFNFSDGFIGSSPMVGPYGLFSDSDLFLSWDDDYLGFGWGGVEESWATYFLEDTGGRDPLMDWFSKPIGWQEPMTYSDAGGSAYHDSHEYPTTERQFASRPLGEHEVLHDLHQAPAPALAPVESPTPAVPPGPEPAEAPARTATPRPSDDASVRALARSPVVAPAPAVEPAVAAAPAPPFVPKAPAPAGPVKAGTHPAPPPATAKTVSDEPRPLRQLRWSIKKYNAQDILEVKANKEGENWKVEIKYKKEVAQSLTEGTIQPLLAAVNNLRGYNDILLSINGKSVSSLFDAKSFLAAVGAPSAVAAAVLAPRTIPKDEIFPTPTTQELTRIANILNIKGTDGRSFMEIGGMKFFAENKFRINTNPDKHYFVIADRETGERAIASQLIDKSDSEEGWVYVEGTIKTDENSDGTEETKVVTIWFECGVGEENGALKTDHIERFFENISLERFASAEKPSVYHQHPVDASNAWSMKSIYPSHGDLGVAVNNLAPILRKRKMMYDFRVITSCGVYTVTVPSHAAKLNKKQLDDYSKAVGHTTFKMPTFCEGLVDGMGLGCKFEYFDSKIMGGILAHIDELFEAGRVAEDLKDAMTGKNKGKKGVQQVVDAKKKELNEIITALPQNIREQFSYLMNFNPTTLNMNQLQGMIKTQLKAAMLLKLEDDLSGLSSEFQQEYGIFVGQVQDFIKTQKLTGNDGSEIAKRVLPPTRLPLGF